MKAVMQKNRKSKPITSSKTNKSYNEIRTYTTNLRRRKLKMQLLAVDWRASIARLNQVISSRTFACIAEDWKPASKHGIDRRKARKTGGENRKKIKKRRNRPSVRTIVIA